MAGGGPFIIELLRQGGTCSTGVDLCFIDSNGDGVIIIRVEVDGA